MQMKDRNSEITRKQYMKCALESNSLRTHFDDKFLENNMLRKCFEGHNFFLQLVSIS